jgi:hypothetical protein
MPIGDRIKRTGIDGGNGSGSAGIHSIRDSNLEIPLPRPEKSLHGGRGVGRCGCNQLIGIFGCVVSG